MNNSFSNSNKIQLSITINQIMSKIKKENILQKNNELILFNFMIFFF